MAKKFRIGTSGFSYKDWLGRFYPKNLPASKWFDYYAARFDVVELNITFYRLPAPAAFKSWYRRSAKNFRFAVKGSRYITHMKRLLEPGPALTRFLEVVQPLKEKLACFLWQFPKSFKENPGRLKKFLEVLQKKTKIPSVFEFRHPSWFSDRTAKILKRYGAVYCRADMPEFYKGLDIPDTGPLIYLRRHGTDQLKKYHGDYPDTTLRRDANEIKKWLKKKKTVYLFFNNDYEGAALRDADKVIKFLEGKR